MRLQNAMTRFHTRLAFACLPLLGCADSISSNASAIASNDQFSPTEDLLASAPLRLESQIVDNFALIDHTGKQHELYRQDDARAVVLISYAVACPILRWSLPDVEELGKKYGEQGVRFFYIDGSPQDDRDSIAKDAQDFGVSVPILHDDAQTVLPNLGVTRTADAFVIDTRNWKVTYRGQINDRSTYGGQSGKSEHDYLDDALASFLKGEQPAVERTNTEGCLILFDHKTDDPAPDYVTEVAPILIDRCVSCHADNGIAPWAMNSWKRVRGWSPMMRETVMTKRMPPWHADPHYGRYTNERGLTPEESGKLVRWIEAGAPRGEGEDPLPAASAAVTEALTSTEWPLGKPDYVLQAKEQKLPATGVVKYRYDRADLDIKEDMWVRGVDLRPSNYQVLHHSVILVKYPEHLREEQPEYLQGVGSYFALYIPGMRSQMFPEGTGKLIPAGSHVIFQFHYTTTGKPEVDRPELALYFMKEPPKIQFEATSAIKWDFKIPPGEANYFAKAGKVFERDIMLVDLIPHMHYRGRNIRYEAHLPDGTHQMLLSVPAYDFNWQTAYHLEPARYLPAGTIVECTGWYDNSDRNPFNPDPTQEVIWGPESTDEMFIGYMNYYALPEGTEPPK
ncbi:MAG: hypothetical protein ACI8TQ_003216 [Planctomycetota bacterium]|jgi:hypothetical protein